MLSHRLGTERRRRCEGGDKYTSFLQRSRLHCDVLIKRSRLGVREQESRATAQREHQTCACVALHRSSGYAPECNTSILELTAYAELEEVEDSRAGSEGNSFCIAEHHLSRCPRMPSSASVLLHVQIAHGAFFQMHKPCSAEPGRGRSSAHRLTKCSTKTMLRPQTFADTA